MKKLTLRARMGDANILLLEEIVNKKFPANFSAFLKDHAGLSFVENVYTDQEKTDWYIKKFDDFKSMYDLTKEFLEAYKRNLIPFAYDPGGWHFCLNLDEQDFGSILINRWTDHVPEEQFLKIADSFEEFIDGLHAEA